MKVSTELIKPQKCFLKPGELLVSSEPAEITTILGTCVAVCLYDPVTKIGGMNHYMLPSLADHEVAPLKYGDFAITQLINRMIKEGAVRSALVAKIFGGSEDCNSVFQIGYRNIDMAKTLLREKKIRIIEMEVGGKGGRKIRFSSWNNCVIVNSLL